MTRSHRGREKKPDKKSVPRRPSSKESRAKEPVQSRAIEIESGLPALPPAHDNNLGLRQEAILKIQQKHGNTQARQVLARQQAAPGPSLKSGVLSPGSIQRKDKKKGSGKSNGEGPGKVKGAEEAFYDVSGKKLSDLTSQLKKYDGYGSKTYVALTIEGEVVPKKKKGKLQIKVKWTTVDHKTYLPRWTDYKDACSAAQEEWDRFMKQTRKHEEKAHVKMANKWVKNLKKKDTVITGKDVDELKQKLAEKQVELGEKLQKKHDACGHGVDIDAILHTDKGVCTE